MTYARSTTGLSLVALALILTPLCTAAWTITDFKSEIALEPNGGVLVHETIDVDFGSEEKHGIYRELPIVYTGDPKDTYTKISDIVVLQDGTNANTDISHGRENLNIRIGDADRTIQGIHEYKITYRVMGVLQDFGEYDELYWNVTGNDWDAPIEHASASVRVPASILQIACYKGARQSETACDTKATADKIATFSATDLSENEGLTLAVGFTHGVVPIVTVEAPPSVADALASPVTQIIIIGTVIVGIALVLRTWWLYGRDRFLRRAFMPGVRSDRDSDVVPETILPLMLRQPVVVEYDSPDDLRPAELGVLMDEHADTLDVSATIVDLASRGHLEITEVPKQWMFGKADYTFTQIAKSEEMLREYEKLLLKNLFKSGTVVQMSALKNTFYEELKEVKDALYKQVIDKKLFPANPTTVRNIYIGVGVALVVVGVLGIIAAVGIISDAAALTIIHFSVLGFSIGMCVVGVAALITSPYMPRKTGYGRELYQRALGYKLFVSGTEKYRAKFYEDKNMFLSVLPYAIVFGVTDKLAGAFKDMGITPPAPTWYHGPNAFNAAMFATSIHNFSTSMGNAMASAPSGSGSSGGGFSGGGFGGGGGGSW